MDLKEKKLFLFIFFLFLFRFYSSPGLGLMHPQNKMHACRTQSAACPFQAEECGSLLVLLFFFFFFLLPLCNWVVVSGWCWLGGSAPSTCAAPRQLGSCQCQCRTGSALGRTGHACWDLTLTPGSQTLACRPGGGSSSHHGSRVPVTTFSVLTSGTLVPAAGPTLAAASPRSRCHSM